MRRLIAILACVTFCSVLTEAEPPNDRVTEEKIVGFWRIAYEPSEAGRKKVYEPSEGYLLLMPNGTFFEIREDCCDGPVVMPAPRTYRIERDSVVLSLLRNDGTEYDARLQYRGLAVVAFREGGAGFRTKKSHVLAVNPSSLNYCWAKVYP
ncbi:MAG TPA: hypothetical protein VF701_07095 [Thermoanaerobaculia bacterium]